MKTVLKLFAWVCLLTTIVGAVTLVGSTQIPVAMQYPELVSVLLFGSLLLAALFGTVVSLIRALAGTPLGFRGRSHSAEWHITIVLVTAALFYAPTVFAFMQPVSAWLLWWAILLMVALGAASSYHIAFLKR